MTEDNEIYSKSYEIKNERTGGNWNECLSATGEPIFEDGQLVGGRIKMNISYSGGGGASEKKYDYERVSIETWRGFVNKAIEIEDRKKKEDAERKKREEERKRQQVEKEKGPVHYFLREYLSRTGRK